MAFCSKCGAEIPDGASFCPKCGNAIGAAGANAAEKTAAPEASPAESEQNQQNQQTQQTASNQPGAGFQNQNQNQAQNPNQGFQQSYGYQQPPFQPAAPVYASNDHTADFTQEDISKNKVTAMAAYLLGTLGIIISLLAASDSPYSSFHSRQALKLEIVTMLLGIISLVLCWTFIVPIAGVVCMIIVFVVRIICFFQVCAGKAKDAPIIGSLPFLK